MPLHQLVELYLNVENFPSLGSCGILSTVVAGPSTPVSYSNSEPCGM